MEERITYSQYLKNENVKIITVKEPFHQQLVRELLMQPEKDEQTKNNQQEGKVQQMEEDYMQEHY